MRKILFNQGKFNKVDIKEKLLEVYDDYLRTNGREKDIEEVVKFSREYYLSDGVFPSEAVIAQNFKFEFEEEEILDEMRFASYLNDKTVSIRERRRLELASKYLNQRLPATERLEILEELVRIDTDVFNDEKDTTTSIHDLRMADIYNEFTQKGAGIRTNIPDIDAVTMGISSGKLAVIFAPPGGFKTSTSLNMVYINSMEGDNSLVLSLEIPKGEYKTNIMARHGYSMNISIEPLKVIKGMLTPEEQKDLLAVEADFEAKLKGKIIFMDSDDVRIPTFASFRTQLKRKIRENNIRTVYVDFIQQFKDFDVKGETDERQLLNKVVSALRYLSVTEDVRFIILSQANRAGYEYADRNEGTMKMTNISEINNLERYAYYIISLYSNDELKMANQVKFGLIKHRGGETISEARTTTVIPKAFVVGDINTEFADYVSYREVAAGAEDGADFDAVQIFGGGSGGGYDPDDD